MTWLRVITSVVGVAFTLSVSAQTFEDVTTAAGFTGLNSSWGSAWADMDNDGDLDVITIGHVQELTPSISQVWRNNGDETFTDVTVEVGYWHTNGDAHGVVWGDFDNDGDQDFYMVKGSTKTDPIHYHDLMLNNGDGTFTNIAAEAGVLGIGHRGRGANSVDFNGDGNLELFFASFSRSDWDKGNMLFRNDGSMTFVDVAPEAGIARDDNQNRTASWADYNNDGHPDLLIMYPCTLYANQGDGTFVDTTNAAGILSIVDCASSAWADYNNDGLLDVYVASGEDGTTPQSTAGFLYHNNGDGTFIDVTVASGTSNPYNARGVVWGDYDNDGFQDLFIANDTNRNPNRLLKNNGDGTFQDVTTETGVGGQDVTGVAVDATFVDYNDDGALDLFVTNGRANLVGEYLLLKNPGNQHNWLKIELIGNQSNRDGLGARVQLTSGATTQLQVKQGPSHYMCQDNTPLHFGLGASDVADSIQVTWPSGRVQTLENIPAGQTLVIAEVIPLPTDEPPTFTDVSAQAGFYGLNASWGGAWSDFDLDGDLDIYTIGHLPNATGSLSQLWQNNGDGTFVDVTAEKALSTEPRDVHAALWADLDNDGDPELALGKGVVQEDFSDELWRNDNGLYFENVAISANFDAPPLGRGVTSADYDLDGDLDVLSLGWLTQAGVASKFFRNEGELFFTDVSEEVGTLTFGEQNRVAAWVDYDNDGLPDVFVAPPCSLFRNLGDGTFADVTDAAGILASDECTSPAWADFDNDGDSDLYVTSGVLDPTETLMTSGFLYRNNGNGTFTDITQSSGTQNPNIARGAVWGDYDSDGFADLYVVNAFNESTPNRLFRNLGDGTFEDLAASAGVEAQVEGGGTDASFADYNDDGFLDLFVTNGSINRLGPYVLLENNGNSNHWLKVNLEGVRSNPDGLMSKLRLTNSDGTMYREHNGQTHYVIQDSTPVHFGLGQTEVVERLDVDWPVSGVQAVANLAVDQSLTITEGLSIVRGYPDSQDKPGCYLFRTHLGWHLSCIGEPGTRYDFTGQITANGVITSVTLLNMEQNDSVQWDSNTISFDLHSRWRNDTIRFTTDGDTVTYDILQDGTPQPRSVFIGKHKVMPGRLPVTLTQ
jgi:hypothetical protein